MTSDARRVISIPGVSGDGRFWPPVADRLPAADKVLADYRLATLRVPALLLWSDADAISPVTVGERLARLLLDASLVVVRGDDQIFALDLACAGAPHIERRLLGERP